MAQVSGVKELVIIRKYSKYLGNKSACEQEAWSDILGFPKFFLANLPKYRYLNYLCSTI